MAHASFPFTAVPRGDSATLAHVQRRLRIVGLPAMVIAALAALTTAGLIQLEDVTSGLESSVSARETANRGLVDDIGTAQRIAAATAIRVADLRPVLDAQLTALDSRDGFLP